MVRQVKPAATWKIILAMAVGAGGLLWHLLACTESPMAFSPDGKDLAFVSMTPYDAEDTQMKGSHIYSLTVLQNRKDVRVIEETSQYLLTAPGFSPDGKNICYLRIPLMTPEVEKSIETYQKQQGERLKQIEKENEKFQKSLQIFPESDRNENLKVTDLIIPSQEYLLDMTKWLMAGDSLMQVELVVRDTKNFEIQHQHDFRIPLCPEMEPWYFTTYLTCKPQYTKDSQRVILPLGQYVYAIEPAKNEAQILVGPISIGEDISCNIAVLAPDSGTIAALLGQDDKAVLVFTEIDGGKVIYKRLEDVPSLSGLAWVNHETLAMLIPADDKNPNSRLVFIQSNGQVTKTINLELPEHNSEDGHTGELALSGNGKYIAIAFIEDVFFLDSSGKLLKHLHNQSETALVQPIFTPDSQQVAFRQLTGNKNGAPTKQAIVFFTPTGDKIARVAIPAPTLTVPGKTPAQPQETVEK